jgi:hypothetical protein
MNRIPLIRVKGLIALWVVIFGVGGYEVYNNTLEQECARSLAATEQRVDQYSKDQADVFTGWLAELTHPPQRLKAVYNQDRQDWLQDLGNRRLGQALDLAEKREHEIELAAQHKKCS